MLAVCGGDETKSEVDFPVNLLELFPGYLSCSSIISGENSTVHYRGVSSLGAT